MHDFNKQFRRTQTAMFGAMAFMGIIAVVVLGFLG
jgi:hypothetical protein